MNKKEFIKFAIAHSDKESLEILVVGFADEIPLIREQLWDIFSDVDSGFIIRDENNKMCLHPKFSKNGKDKK